MTRRSRSAEPTGPFDISVSRIINAPRSQVYEVISDITSMGRLSPENLSTEWTDDGRAFIGFNRIGPLYRWKMTGSVTENKPGRVFGFITDHPSDSHWTYTFEEAPEDPLGSTVVTETVTTNRRQLLPVIALQLIAGVYDRRSHLRRGMATTLENLAAELSGTPQTERTQTTMSTFSRNAPKALDYTGTTVLITGASSGLGAEFASQLAARGADLVLVARRKDRLAELSTRLEKDHGITADVIAADLSAPGAADSLVHALDERDLEINSLINNAGFGIGGQFIDEDPERLSAMIDLNVRLLTDLCRQLLPRLVESSRRGAEPSVLLNVASTAAYQPTPGMAAYGATKAYVLSLTEALAYETRKTPLKVLALSPGPTATEFFEVLGGTEDKDGKEPSTGSFQSAEQVVSHALQQLDRGAPAPSTISGRRNSLVAAFAQLIPRRLALALSGRALG